MKYLALKQNQKIEKVELPRVLSGTVFALHLGIPETCKDRSRAGGRFCSVLSLPAQVKALQAQIEEQTRLAKDQVEALLEDRRIQMEEAEVRHQRDQDTIKAMTEK